MVDMIRIMIHITGGDKDKTGSGIKYLVTPDGKLQKYDPKTGKTTVISTNLPRDPKAPSPNPTGE